MYRMMSKKMAPMRFALLLAVTTIIVVGGFFIHHSSARNIAEYRDVVSTSAPSLYANHTLSFVINTDIPAEGYIDIDFPADFSISTSSLFSGLRNVQLSVDGVRREVGAVLSLSDDLVTVTPGPDGVIRYQLNQSAGISTGSRLEFKIGNHTDLTQVPYDVYSTSTGTTTEPGDIKPIQNSDTVGSHSIMVRAYDAAHTEIADAGFVVFMIEQVGVGPADTREDIPPDRFNGQPSGQLSGTTVNVEVSVETNEFSICRYSLVPDVLYNDMPHRFDNTGLVVHTTIMSVVPESVNNVYVRCMDDEFNINTDDYLITFSVNARPTGETNSEGSDNGDGSGTGNSGSGTGNNTGGSNSSGSGSSNESSSNNSGGSGGGGGGGGGGGSSSGGGGGFESTDGPYRSGDGQVVITGRTFPRAKVTVLVDGKIAESGTAGVDGGYEITVDKIARGAYTFGIYATDAAAVKTSTFSTSFSVAGARTSALSNINLAPSIKVTPDPVDVGAPLTISGYSFPNAIITLENEKDKNTASRKVLTATAGSNGAWSVSVDTGGFSNGTYKVRAKGVVDGGSTSAFSTYTLYGVGQAAVSAGGASDLSRDGKVNLTDFSILLYWWNTAGGNSEPPADISRDGKVNLTDFSILLFNWTG